MKRNCFVFFALLFSVYNTYAQVKDPDEIIHKVFASLQAKDQEEFITLCPDSTQLVRIMKTLADGVIADIKSDIPKNFSRSSMRSLDKSLEPVRSSLRKTYSPEAIQALRNSFSENFHRMIETGKLGDVDWATTTFTNYTIDSARGGNFLYGQNLLKNSPYQSVSGKIYFKDKDSTCQVWFSDMFYSSEEKKWYAGTLEMLVLPGMEVRDVVMQNIQEAPPPPPPPPLRKKFKGKVISVKKKRPPKS